MTTINEDQIEDAIDCAVFAVPHQEFIDIEPEGLVAHFGRPFALVDAQHIVSNQKVVTYQQLGCTARAVGRGNIGPRTSREAFAPAHHAHRAEAIDANDG